MSVSFTVRPLRRCGWLPVLLLTACASLPGTPPEAPVAPQASHENLNAVLWMQTAAEYRAAMIGSFNLAQRQLDAALADPGWDALPPAERAGQPLAGLAPAVIVDADETMIDNSPFQVESLVENAGFTDERWTRWTAARRATALPGALEFARHAAERGVTILFVTNRRDPEDLAATGDNLAALGFPLAADRSNLMLSGDVRAPAHEKGERRRWAAQRYRVLLMLGDNLGDFVDGFNIGIAGRDALVEQYRPWWGERWIMLPNPSYGSWERAIRHDCAAGLNGDMLACKRAALRP